VKPGKRLAALLDEMFTETREQFRTYGQIDWHVTDVTPRTIAVRVEARRETDGAAVARRVKNGMLGLLRGMVPCPKFRAIFANPTKRVSTTHILSFYGPDVRTRDLPGNIIWIEENAAPFRREWRPRIRRAWREIVQGGRSSKGATGAK
jgi:hypothetical protein